MINAGTQVLLNAGPDAAQLKCRVAEVEDGYLLIDYPIDSETGRTVFLVGGTQLDASFQVNDEAVYSFRTEVMGRVKRNIPMIRITFPGTEGLEKVQRRQYVRVEAALDAAIELNGKRSQHITADISAGGCALKLKSQFQLAGGETVQLVLVLPFEGGKRIYLQLQAEVLRIWEGKSDWIASLKFEDLNDRDRQHIVRYCFEIQRQNLRQSAAT